MTAFMQPPGGKILKVTEIVLPMTPLSDGYVRRARLCRVYDGDTVFLDIDLGWDMTMNEEGVRLWGIDAPEIRTTDLAEKSRAIESKMYVEAWFTTAATNTDSWPLLLHSMKRGKYGRVLGAVYRAFDGANLADDMVASGVAIHRWREGPVL